jgi:hypothetical protein
VGLVLLFSFLIYSVIDGERSRNDMKTHYCYTIAVTDGKEYKRRRGMCVIYHYEANGEKHTSSTLIEKQKININGASYLIKVYTKDTGYHEVYFDKPITDTTNFCYYIGKKCCN